MDVTQPNLNPAPKSRPKKQHYNPQFMLSRFAQSSDGMLYILDKKTGAIRPSRPRETAHENHFYDFTDGVGVQDCLEEDLVAVDTAAAPLFASICKRREIRSLSPEAWATIDWFVIVQMLRTPSAKSQLARMASALREPTNVAPEGSDLWQIGNTTYQQSAEAAFQIIRRGPRQFPSFLAGKSRVLLTTDGDATFYTSDRPVVRQNRQGNLPGLDCIGVEVYLPLSPQVLLAYICPILTRAAMEEYPSMIPVLTGREVALATRSNVESLNNLQVRYCTRFVYSCSESFEDGKKLLNAEPKAEDPPALEVRHVDERTMVSGAAP